MKASFFFNPRKLVPTKIKPSIVDRDFIHVHVRVLGMSTPLVLLCHLDFKISTLINTTMYMIPITQHVRRVMVKATFFFVTWNGTLVFHSTVVVVKHLLLDFQKHDIYDLKLMGQLEYNCKVVLPENHNKYKFIHCNENEFIH